MRLLLDTHVALWAIVDDRRLGARARELLLAPDATPFVSSASLWEIAIKYALGRGDMPIDAARASDFFSQSGFEELPIRWVHTIRAGWLPSIHRDPFDRLLIAQALEEPLVLLTRDPVVARYSDAILLV